MQKIYLVINHIKNEGDRHCLFLCDKLWLAKKFPMGIWQKNLTCMREILNWVLGSIGTTLLELGEKWQEEIPPIQGIVVNKGTGLPGDGVNFIAGKLDPRQLDPRQKEAIVQEKLGSVFSYPKWLDVLKACGLSPAKPLNPPEPPDPRSRTHESEAHKRFKNYIARHPEVLRDGDVRLKKSLAPGETEHKLPSGDIPDVLFQNARCRIAVEVKSRISNEDDLRRGLFQCVKYRAILRACRSLEGGTYEADALLAIEGSLPKELIPVKNTLGVKVFEIKDESIHGQADAAGAVLVDLI